MPENRIRNKDIKKFERRAGLPRLFRTGALLALLATVIGVIIGFYLNYGKEEFRMRGLKKLKLSDKALAEVKDYQRIENDEGRVIYQVRADKATTFQDNHQELENIVLEIIDENSGRPDRITANKAIYVPGKKETRDFTAFFAGDVRIDTRDGLNVKTEQLSYQQKTQTAEAEEYVEFSNPEISGTAVGAILNSKEETLELLREVKIAARGGENGGTDAVIRADHGYFNRPAGTLDFRDNVLIKIPEKRADGDAARPTEVSSAKATAFLTGKKINRIDLTGDVRIYQQPGGRSDAWYRISAGRAVARLGRELKYLELFENVGIESAGAGQKPTRIRAGYGLYQKDRDRFELKNGVEINTAGDPEQSAKITSDRSIYDRPDGKVFLVGAARVVKQGDVVKGDTITARLRPDQSIRGAVALGNAYLKHIGNSRTTEITARELTAIFGEGQRLENAYATGDIRSVIIPNQSKEFTKAIFSTPQQIDLQFQEGVVSQLQTSGRTTISLEAPDTSEKASNKKLTADKVRAFWKKNGVELERAEATGNAELLVRPVADAQNKYQTTVRAHRFDCDFYPGNGARSCVATGDAVATRIPMFNTTSRGRQILRADKLNSEFSRQNGDIDRYEAFGSTKFSELDRRGTADQMSFSKSDSIVRLRGGAPTVWDSRGRAKALEIDWDTDREKSVLRGKVSTTYYSQKKSGGAAPFGETNSPVFLTSAEAAFDHRAETAVYTGNARAWQGDNYVRADKLFLDEKAGRLYGEGSVQSLLYDARRREDGREKTVPVYAAADKILYIDNKRYLRYENNVDIRQGTDRILAGVADIYLGKDNSVRQTVAEKNVILTQPDRRATGDYVKYDADDETFVLRGSPARIEDRQQGSTQGSLVTVYLRENRFVGESQTPTAAAGRIRSVYKVKKNP